MTALTPPEHERNAAVEEAPRWLAEQKAAPHPIIPELRSRFALSAAEACEACAMADRYRLYRKVRG